MAPPDFVERPDVMEMVRKTVTSGTGQYDVIVGNHGTGKSTIVMKIAAETAGVVYVGVSEKDGGVRAGLAAALVDALGGERPPSLLKAYWNKAVDKGLLRTSTIV